MKNLRKGFTLVEMLIVVVIIGILAAAILPRLQGAQGATRDVAREKGLTDISSALEMYMSQKGEYPADTSKNARTDLNRLLVEERGYMKDFPVDPSKSAKIKVGTGAQFTTNDYGYVRIKRGGVDNAAYVLVAKVETPDKANATAKMVEALKNDLEYNDMKPCSEVVKGTTVKEDATWKAGVDCAVTKYDDLRFVMIR